MGSWIKRHRAWVVTGLIVIACLGITAFVFVVFGVMKSSEPVRVALGQVQSNAAVADHLGKPITPGWWVTGSIDGGADSGYAEVVLPLRGSKGKGTMNLVAVKTRGIWMYSVLNVTFDDSGNTVDLMK